MQVLALNLVPPDPSGQVGIAKVGCTSAIQVSVLALVVILAVACILVFV